MTRQFEKSGDAIRAFRNPGQTQGATLQWGKVNMEAHEPDKNTQKLVDALQALTLDSLEGSLNRLFEGADDALFEMARGAANNREQTTFLDAMRAVRLGRGRTQQTFLQEVRRHFHPDAPHKRSSTKAEDDIDSLTLTDSNILEKAIAISNISNRADELFKPQLWELGRRMNTLINERGAQISPQAISPISFCEAFRVAADTQDMEISVTLVLYKLFERIVVAQLPTLYGKLLKLLDDNSIRPEKIAVTTPHGSTWHEPAPAAAPMPPQGYQEQAYAPASHAPQPQMTVPTPQAARGYPQQPAADFASQAAQSLDAHTLQLLQQLRPAMPANIAPQTYTDQHLADDLISAALGRMVPGWEPASAKAYVRRTDAVGQMFNGIIADPHLPSELKSQFDQLRFSVIKTALQDVSFFANPSHPVRGLVHELATLATTARTSNMQSLQRMEDLVNQIQGQFDVAAESVRRPSGKIAPEEQSEIDHFLSDQIEKNKDRRKSIIDRVRRVVSEELQLRCTGRNIPDTAWPLLKSGWAPMMAAHLLRHGLDCTQWRDGLKLLDRILTALDPHKNIAATEPANLCTEADARFNEVGLLANRRKELIEAFLAALDETEVFRQQLAEEARAEAMPATGEPVATKVTPLEPKAAPPPEAKPVEPDLSPLSLISALIAPGNWFRILDARSGKNRWMKAVAHYPGHDNIAFAEFNGRNSLFIKTQPFLDGIVDGSIEPLDLMPIAQNLVEHYISAHRKAA
jgi:hypothetical protein